MKSAHTHTKKNVSFQQEIILEKVFELEITKRREKNKIRALLVTTF